MQQPEQRSVTEHNGKAAPCQGLAKDSVTGAGEDISLNTEKGADRSLQISPPLGTAGQDNTIGIKQYSTHEVISLAMVRWKV